MTTRDLDGAAGADGSDATLEENLQKLDELTHRLLHVINGQRQTPVGLFGPSPELFAQAASEYWITALSNPEKIFDQQIAYWGEALKNFIAAQDLLAQDGGQTPDDSGPTDVRFAHALWRTNPFFYLVQQQYQSNARAIRDAIGAIETLEDADKARLAYFAEQIVDLMCPTNFLATNPDALSHAAETKGASLVRGLENLIRDFEENDGDLIISLSDKAAFQLGGNLATTPGKVVFRNRLFELLQFAPATETVHAVPLVIFPPWINKYYILDLKPQNSLIRWLVDQGYTVFVVSWVNPDASFADTDITAVSYTHLTLPTIA